MTPRTVEEVVRDLVDDVAHGGEQYTCDTGTTWGFTQAGGDEIARRAYQAGAAAEREAVVGWLRQHGWKRNPTGSAAADALADAIEGDAHHLSPPATKTGEGT